MTMTPCLECGEPTNGSRCAEHQLKDQRRDHRTDIKTSAWIQLSKRARRLQPFCAICGSTTRLQADHSPRAWSRMANHLSIRLCDITVVCGRCNVQAGSSQPGSDRYKKWETNDGNIKTKNADNTLRVGLTTRGGDPQNRGIRLVGEAKSLSHMAFISDKSG